MFDILRDPLWQFAGAILAVLAIAISIVLYRLQRQSKELIYEIVSSTPLLGIQEEVDKKLQILFDGTPVEDVHLVELSLMNSGNTPILVTDYERPISLSFAEETQVLTAEIVETNPESLHASAKVEGKIIAFEPVLLNQGDLIKTKMLLSKFDGQGAVDGRIVGVRDIKPKPEPFIPLGKLRLLYMAVSVFYLAAGSFLMILEPWDTIGTMFFAMGAIGIGICELIRRHMSS